jgi:type IV fimbrial biogenesis protein FimT
MKRQSGLTIVEIMITLAIAAVLLGIALPAFDGFIEQRRMTTQVNAFLLSVQYSRSEATRRGTNVSMIALDASDDADEWGPGWCVVAGNPAPANCPAPGAVTSLRRFDAMAPNTLTGEGALDTVDRLTFNSRGLLVGAVGGTLDLCGAAAGSGRRISLAATGRASSSEVVCP